MLYLKNLTYSSIAQQDSKTINLQLAPQTGPDYWTEWLWQKYVTRNFVWLVEPTLCKVFWEQELFQNTCNS